MFAAAKRTTKRTDATIINFLTMSGFGDQDSGGDGKEKVEGLVGLMARLVASPFRSLERLMVSISVAQMLLLSHEEENDPEKHEYGERADYFHSATRWDVIVRNVLFVAHAASRHELGEFVETFCSVRKTASA